MKYQTKGAKIRHRGREYRVNSGTSDLYTPILHKLIDQFDVCILKWGRVFVVRFDLHQGSYTPKNVRISKFRKNLAQKLKNEYGISDLGFIWVREQERAKAQHYHFALFMDGDLIRHSSRLMRIIRATWEKMPADHVPIIKNPFYRVNGEINKSDAIYRLSYLAKARGKGYRPDQTKDYSTSRLLPPKTTSPTERRNYDSNIIL